MPKNIRVLSLDRVISREKRNIAEAKHKMFRLKDRAGEIEHHGTKKSD